jgi:hypothetical protein
LHEALTDLVPAIVEPMVRPIAQEEAYKVSRDKFEKVLGIDCTSAEARKRGRTAMEAAGDLRDWKQSPSFEIAKKNVEWAGKARTYFEETEEGKQSLVDAKRLAKIVEKAQPNLWKNVFYIVVAVSAAMGASGVVDPHGVISHIKKIFVP